ncbi:hypothetical protein EPN44_04725 [bacterium]|nr:MAG: hypothetical protein EPN44_04725 [bacterium]
MAIHYQTAEFDAQQGSGAYREPTVSVRYRVADVDIEVRGPKKAIASLERAFSRLPRVPADEGSAATIAIRHDANGWMIDETLSDQPRILDARAGGGGWLAMEVANSIISEVAARSKFLIIHAAVLERDGEALAVAGRGFAGKSTVATHLLSRGWRMLSDEYAFVEPISGRLVPYQKLMYLRSGVIPLLPSSFRRSVEQSPWYGAANDGLGFYAIDPALSYGEQAWASGAHLRAVALLEAERAERPQVTECDPWSLIPEFQTLVWKSGDLLTGLAKLASALRGVRVSLVRPGSPLETADALETWFDSARTP